MLTLHVEADRYDQLVKQAWAALGLKIQGQVAVDTPAKETAALVVTDKKPVGRPKKEAPEKTPDPVTQASPEATPAGKATEEASKAPATPASPITLEQVRAGLQAYADKAADGKAGNVGILKAREVLAKFTSVKGTPCQKISEVQDADYPAILALCAA